jgi:acyl-coenzyme A thioesterase PaaI-like protein
VSDAEAKSIQEQLFPDLPCFGCGPTNDKGLRLRSYPAPDGSVVASFLPWPEHNSGLGYLNGGIIATLLDCHSAAAVTYEAELRGWKSIEDAALPYVTAGLDVRYLRPSPLHEQVELRAVIVEADESQMVSSVELIWDGKPRAAARAWLKRWRPGG